MAVLPLVYYGNPLLKKKSKEITDFKGVQQLITDMFDTMYDHAGVGLAAVQVDHPIRLFIINAEQDPDTGAKGREEVFINPVLLKAYGKAEEAEEGCLCTPEVRDKVSRKTLVDIEYTDREGARQKETGITGLRARVIQHEYDHLEGMLFVDRLSVARKLLIRRELNQIVKEYS